MPLPERLDRIWLWIIGIAFLFIVPIWIALWWERHPLLGLVQLAFIGWRVVTWVIAPPAPEQAP